MPTAVDHAVLSLLQGKQSYTGAKFLDRGIIFMMC